MALQLSAQLSALGSAHVSPCRGWFAWLCWGKGRERSLFDIRLKKLNPTHVLPCSGDGDVIGNVLLLCNSETDKIISFIKERGSVISLLSPAICERNNPFSSFTSRNLESLLWHRRGLALQLLSQKSVYYRIPFLPISCCLCLLK